MNLELLIKQLDESLIVTDTKVEGKTIYIYCEREKCLNKCIYCGKISDKVHSKYVRKIKDLSIQGFDVKLILTVKKYFCNNKKCKHKTFAEQFDFVETSAVRTKRLDDYINKIGLRDNSMDAVRTLKDTGIDVSSSTVLRIVKKKKR